MDALKVDGWLRRVSHWLLPARCLICSERGTHGIDLCLKCRGGLPWNRSACSRCALPLPLPGLCGRCLRKPPPMTESRAVFVYGPPIDRLTLRFKFHRDLAAGRLLADLMAEELAQHPLPQALVPVPLHRNRLRRRGYDQALELAKPLATRLRLPLRADALIRVRATAPQSELDASARRRNPKKAFMVDARIGLPAHIALIDDVMTTGATLRAAAETLHRAGVQRVDAWVCARVP